MKLEEFEAALRDDDFCIGDSFWLGDWEFEVVNRKRDGRYAADEVVFKWELTRREFIQVIAENYPEIDDSEGFFDRHKDDVVYRLERGSAALIGGWGPASGSLMNEAIDKAVQKELEKSLPETTGALAAK